MRDGKAQELQSPQAGHSDNIFQCFRSQHFFRTAVYKGQYAQVSWGEHWAAGGLYYGVPEISTANPFLCPDIGIQLPCLPQKTF